MIINICALHGKEMVYIMRKYEPVYRMIISRNTGKLNRNFGILKNQLIDLVQFATVQGSDGDTPQSYPTEEELALEKKNEKVCKMNDVVVPHIHNTEELKRYVEPLYIIENHMDSYQEYNDFINSLYAVICGCFEIKECREFPVKFKFRHNSAETYVLEFRHFILNLFTWYAFVELKGKDILGENNILDCSKNMHHIHEWIDEHIIEVLRDYQIKSTTINKCVSEILYRMRLISDHFSILMNLNFSLKTIIDFENKYPEAKEIMESEYSDDVQPADVEMMGEKKLSKLIDIFISDPGNPIGVILGTGTGIKYKQLGESLIEAGQISDIEGNTIPIVRSNSILQGFHKPSEIYLSCLGGRKPLLMNKESMGRAGYFAKELTMIAKTVSLSTHVSDCGTKHLVKYDIKSRAALNKFNGKYYKLNPNDNDLKVLNSRTDTHLIGKTIYVRSVATCACHGDEVCHKCWGRIASFNFDIPQGISAHDAEEVGQQLQQDILSTKHLLTTKSEKIEFNGPFDKFFTIHAGQIGPNPELENEDDMEDHDYVLYIDPEDVIRRDEFDSDSQFNTCIKNGTFYVMDECHPEAEPIKINTLDSKELYISEEILEATKKNKGKVHLKDVGDEFTIFEISIANNELTKPLKDIMSLLNSRPEDSATSETIDSVSQRMLDLMVDAKMHAPITSAECLINRIISKPEETARPDFSEDEMPEYQIITVTKAIETGEYPTLGLAFQYIKRQLLNDELFETRVKPSYLDAIYQKEVSTENFKEYNKLIGKEPVSKFLHY